MTRPVFSPELFNARVETQIQTFFDSINNFYGRRGWMPSPPRREDTTWSNDDFTVTILSRYRDGAFKRVGFTMRNLPGYTQKPSQLTSNRALRYEHRFVFDLPREYPQSIGMIHPTAETPLFHPRLSSSGTGPACYSVRGELDRILEDLPFFVLLKPDRVEPPSQFQSDHGLNTTAMAWYEADAENIVTTLDRLWEERHQIQGTRSVPERRIKILEGIPPSRQAGSRPPRILGDTSHERKVRILDTDDNDS
ncbi:MAG: hypothetical protein ACFE89_03295 [Candidatus Hodarchaeota archaeon]